MDTVLFRRLLGLVCIFIGLLIFTHPQKAGAQSEPPTAQFIAAPGNEGTTQTEFVFDASLSTDDLTSLENLQVRWDWNNDGEFDTDFDTIKVVTRRFFFASSFAVTLEVMDEEGLSDTSQQTLVVSFAPDPGAPPETANIPFEFPFFSDDVVFDPIRPRAYVISDSNNQLYQINLSTGLIDKVFDLGLSPEQMTITPDGSTLYVGLQKGRFDDAFPGEEEGIDAFITTFDLQETTKINQYGVSHGIIDMVATDDRHLYLTSSSDHLISYRANFWTEISRSEDSSDGSIKLHPSQSKIYGVDRRGRVEGWAIDNGTITSTWDSPYDSRHNPHSTELFIDPSGNQLVTNEGEVYAIVDTQDEDLQFVRDIFIAFTTEDAIFDSRHSAFFWEQRGELTYSNSTNFQTLDEVRINRSIKYIGVYGDSLYALTGSSSETEIKTALNPMLGAESSTPPVASFTISPSSGLTTDEFVFDASASTDGETEDAQLIVRWDWDNNGSYDTEYSTDKVEPRLFTEPGTYEITMEIRDEFGFSTTETRTLEVEFGEETGETNVEQKKPYQFPSSYNDVIFDPLRPYAYAMGTPDKKIYFLNLLTGIVEKQFSFEYLPDVLFQTEDGSTLYALLLTHRRSASPKEGEPYGGIIAEFDLDRQVKTNQFALDVYPIEFTVSSDGVVYASHERNNHSSAEDISAFDVTDGSFIEVVEELPDSVYFGLPLEESRLYSALFASGYTGSSSFYTGRAIDTLNTTIFLTKREELSAYHLEQHFEITTNLRTRGLGTHVGVYGDSVYVANIFGGELGFIDSFLHPYLAGKDNALPIATFSISPDNGTTNTVYTFDASASEDTDTPTELLEVRWDWESDGVYDTEFSTNKVGEHKYSFEGTKQVTLQVKDELGLRSTLTTELNVSFGPDSGQPPEVTNAPYQIPFEVTDAFFVPGQQYIYMTAGSDKKVFVLNLESGLIEKEYTFAFYPETLALTPSGERLYITLLPKLRIKYEDDDERTGIIAEFDVSSQTKTDQFQVTIDPRDMVAADDGFLYIAGGTRTTTKLYSYRVRDRFRVDTESSIYRSALIKWHPYGEKIYAIQPSSSDFSIQRFFVESGRISENNASPNRRNFTEHDFFIDPSGEFLITSSNKVFSLNDELFSFINLQGPLSNEEYTIEDVFFDEAQDMFYTISSNAVQSFKYEGFEYVEQVPLRYTGISAGVYEDILYVLTQNGRMYQIERFDLSGASIVSNEGPADIPDRHDLYPNYPNPFNQATTLKFGLSDPSQVTINIFNTMGQKVASLLDAHLEAGYHEYEWQQPSLSSGIYFAQMSTDDGFTSTVKLMIVR